jgi:endonuclease/exonuclease/phosphatase family metal-dependent hydrolase
VVTFNIQWGEHIDRALKLFEAQGPMHDADLIVLEEMERNGTERIATALGCNWIYVPSAVHPTPKHDFGVALLSPWPLEEPRKLLLPHEEWFSHLRRSAAVATLRSPLGPIRVYGVHFQSPTGAWGSVRRDQARTILADAEGWDGPVVVAGDFNGRGGPAELAKAGYFWPTEMLRHTAGPFDFDHVLARGLCAGAPLVSGVVPDPTHASDHRPVWTLLSPCQATVRRTTGGGGGVPRANSGATVPNAHERSVAGRALERPARPRVSVPASRHDAEAVDEDRDCSREQAGPDRCHRVSDRGLVGFSDDHVDEEPPRLRQDSHDEDPAG